jgi:hypothetical protein
MAKKILYLLFINLEFVTIFLINIIKGNKDRAVFLIFGQFATMFGVVQPLVYLSVNRLQSTHVFLCFKYLFLSALCLYLLVLNETVFLQSSSIFGLTYPAILLVYLLFESLNSSIMKLIYKLVGIHKEDDLFNYPKDFDLTANDSSADIFFEYASNPKIINNITYLRSKQLTTGYKSKKELIWKIMKSIIQLKKEEENIANREERKNKIESYYQSLKREKEEIIESQKAIVRRMTARVTKKPKLNATFDLSENEIRQTQQTFTSPHINTETNLTQQYIKDNSSTFEKRIVESPGLDFTYMQILKLRLNTIHMPKKIFNKILYIVFFPFYFIFLVSMPSLKTVINVREAYFGFLICIAYLISLSLLFEAIVSTSSTFWNFGYGSYGLLASVLCWSYLIYCASFGIHAEKYFNISVQEMMILQITILMGVSAIYDFFQTNFMKTTTVNMLLVVSVLFCNGIFFTILSVFLQKGISRWIMMVFFSIFASYLIIVLLQSI